MQQTQTRKFKPSKLKKIRVNKAYNKYLAYTATCSKVSFVVIGDKQDI
jgi:hypothetical protein